MFDLLTFFTPEGRKIDENKKQDLLSLFDYIPPIKHGFYTNILSTQNVANTIPVDSEEDSEGDDPEDNDEDHC